MWKCKLEHVPRITQPRRESFFWERLPYEISVLWALFPRNGGGDGSLLGGFLREKWFPSPLFRRPKRRGKAEGGGITFQEICPIPSENVRLFGSFIRL